MITKELTIPIIHTLLRKLRMLFSKKVLIKNKRRKKSRILKLRLKSLGKKVLILKKKKLNNPKLFYNSCLLKGRNLIGLWTFLRYNTEKMKRMMKMTVIMN